METDTDGSRPRGPAPGRTDPLHWAAAAAVVTVSAIALLAVLALAGFTPEQVARLVEAVAGAVNAVKR